MKKLLSIVLCAVMLINMASVVLADAVNMADGLKTDVTVMKANPQNVVKDGIIGKDEYTEVLIDRDPDGTDLLLSWNNNVDGSSLLEQCQEFLQSVHYYFSWDEVNGLNIAAKATLLETPVNTSALPEPGTGDTFLFQFGMMASVVKKKKTSDDVMYRGISINTETGDLLIGDYGVHGYNDAAKNFVAGENYMVRINGNEITYEISYPIEAIVEASDRNNNIPNDGSMIMMNVSLTGGSIGTHTDGAKCYAVSLGDGGYMTSKWAGTNLSPAKVHFSHETFGEVEIPEGPEMSFTDVLAETEDVWYFNAVKTCYESGLMGGFDDGNFYPNNIVTRGDLALIIYNIAKHSGVDMSLPEDHKVSFPDISPDSFYYDAVTWCSHQKLLLGDPTGKFNPESDFNRAQLAAILMKLTEILGIEIPDVHDTVPTFTDVEKDHWAIPYIEFVYKKDLMRGASDTKFAPDEPIIRGAMAVTVGTRLYPYLDLTPTAERVPDMHVHVYEPVTVEPTCTEDGYTAYECVCGDNHSKEIIATEGHIVGDIEVIIEPTCESAGDIILHCANCDYSEPVHIEALGHDIDPYWTYDVEPTETSEGEKSHHCLGCDKRFDVTVAPKKIDSNKIFKDVPAEEWAKESIDFVLSNGLMKGTSNDLFNPEGTMTRAMVVTVLYRMEGEPAIHGASSFEDLKEDWYMNAVAWAHENDIVLGTSKTTFSPDAEITREQLATILHRYSEYKEYDVNLYEDIEMAFPDYSATNDWAEEAIWWAVSEGLITGSNESGTLMLKPQGDATRVQVAAILTRFCKKH